MSPISFQEELENIIGKKLLLRINDNLSTMLSVKWEPNCTKVSLHRFFLRAPQNVMESLACYIGREHRTIDPTVKSFIESNYKKLDYSRQIDRNKLCVQGNIYNLQLLYNELNKEYFKDQLNLSITWYGNLITRSRSKLTFGLYYDPLKLIKINRLLDSPSFPNYVVSYVIYHEMVHHVCPSYVDKSGIRKIHSKEFKEREKAFCYYDLAKKWIKDNFNIFFKSSRK